MIFLSLRALCVLRDTTSEEFAQPLFAWCSVHLSFTLTVNFGSSISPCCSSIKSSAHIRTRAYSIRHVGPLAFNFTRPTANAICWKKMQKHVSYFSNGNLFKLVLWTIGWMNGRVYFWLWTVFMWILYSLLLLVPNELLAFPSHCGHSYRNRPGCLPVPITCFRRFSWEMNKMKWKWTFGQLNRNRADVPSYSICSHNGDMGTVSRRCGWEGGVSDDLQFSSKIYSADIATIALNQTRVALWHA